MSNFIDYHGKRIGTSSSKQLIEKSYLDYMALPSADKLDPTKEYFVDDASELSGLIVDSVVSETDTWSSQKINNINKTTTFEVGATDWTDDTTSQSGVTLKKKQVSLNHVYVQVPNVDIASATGYVLPSAAEQTAYNLVQYVTVDSTVPCLYLYASDTPADTFYIKVGGVD